jgi:GntR family transcriptional regulator
MARELAINPNTVARAYQQLQADGVLEQVRGMGLEVAADAVKQCKGERQTMIQERIREALVEAKQSGLDGDALRQIVEKQVASVFRDGR